MNIRFASLVPVLALVAACSGNDSPELEPLSLSAGEIEAGGTVVGTAVVNDDDGDLDGGKMVVILRTDEPVSFQLDRRDLPIALGAEATKAAVSLSLNIAPSAPKGPVIVELTVFDSAGHGSNAQTASLTIK